MVPAAPLRGLMRRLHRQFWRRPVGRAATFGRRPFSQVFFVVEGNAWAISWDGRYIVPSVRRQFGVDTRMVPSSLGVRNQIVHFGSRNNYLLSGYRDVHSSNRVVFSWAHGTEADRHPENQLMIARLAERAPHVEKVTCTHRLAAERVIGWGVPREKVVVNPIGVDPMTFRLPARGERAAIRERLGIPADCVCLGLFQKDGEGWGDGMRPKWVKGPEVFLEVVRRLAAQYRLFILLTGPARGFVRHGLERLGVPYRHRRLRNYFDVVPFYQALDLYVIPSREEGGPKALLECMATGVPVVSTRVGMCSDLIRDGENGYLTDVDDAGSLAEYAAHLIESPELRARLAAEGRKTAEIYTWDRTARLYYETLYHPLLGGLVNSGSVGRPTGEAG